MTERGSHTSGSSITCWTRIRVSRSRISVALRWSIATASPSRTTSTPVPWSTSTLVMLKPRAGPPSSGGGSSPVSPLVSLPSVPPEADVLVSSPLVAPSAALSVPSPELLTVSLNRPAPTRARGQNRR